MWDNYSQVQEALRAAGMVGREIEALDIGRLVRCHVEGSREKRGWYILHELPARDAGSLLVGSYGIWQGAENNARKIELTKDTLTKDQLDALRVKWREDRQRVERARQAEAARAAARAESIWRKCSQIPPEGGADYLARKGVQAHGVRYTPSGALVLAMHDAGGRVHGLQFILSKTRHKDRISRTGNDKEYWPPGMAKKGRYFQIGAISSVVAICEGYATAASTHEALPFLPVVVAFDAGNLMAVAQAIRHAHRDAHILICADDDFASKGNPGAAAASAAALAVDGAWVSPRFSVPDQIRARERVSAEVDWSDLTTAKAQVQEILAEAQRKLTDFNDLHQAEGLLTVRSQIEGILTARGWHAIPSAPTPHTGGEGRAADDWRFDLYVLCDEYTLIYGTDTVFDQRRRMVLGLGPLRSAAGKGLVRQWLEHPNRRMVMPEQVGFDPSGADSKIVCNLWGGWPSQPKAGSCARLLELLSYLCNNDRAEQRELYTWVLNWLAYPLQHPGAKMQTALLVHGPEGTGKNTFFGAVRRIYGRYAVQFSQVELESNFNGWASGKLLAIGNEVVSRAELYHIQGRLKAMVTEPEWVINEKMLPARAEANHCNLVFFSNRIDIAKLDSGDRRYCVIWTPPALDETFYQAVADEICNGGVEALHHYLLHLDLSGFDAHTKPPMTSAKRDLVELGMDSTARFYRDWIRGVISQDLARPCRSQDLYRLYRWWVQREGIPRAAQKQTLLCAIGKEPGVRKADERYLNGAGLDRATVVTPPDANPPEGMSRSAWLGKELKFFFEAMQEITGQNGI